MQYKWGHTLAAKAIHLETNLPVVPSRVVIIPKLQFEMNSLRSSTFSLMEASSRLFCLYGSAGLLPVSVFEKLDMLCILFLIGFDNVLGKAVYVLGVKTWNWVFLLLNEVVNGRTIRIVCFGSCRYCSGIESFIILDFGESTYNTFYRLEF
jgi:hypothetical protein